MTGDRDRVVILTSPFIQRLLQAVRSIAHFRTTAEVQLQLLRTLQITLTAAPERLLQQAVDLQLLSFQTGFLLTDRRRLLTQQRVFLLQQDRLLCQLHRLITLLQAGDFLSKRFQFVHARKIITSRHTGSRVSEFPRTF